MHPASQIRIDSVYTVAQQSGFATTQEAPSDGLTTKSYNLIQSMARTKQTGRKGQPLGSRSYPIDVDDSDDAVVSMGEEEDEE